MNNQQTEEELANIEKAEAMQYLVQGINKAKSSKQAMIFLCSTLLVYAAHKEWCDEAIGKVSEAMRLLLHAGKIQDAHEKE